MKKVEMKGEDEYLENMASRTVNARKAAETVTTGSIESEMDAKESSKCKFSRKSI